MKEMNGEMSVIKERCREIDCTYGNNSDCSKLKDGDNTMKNVHLISFKELLVRVPYTRASIYRLMGEGKFPKSVKLGRAVAWVESEVTDWIEGKMASRVI